MFAQLIVRQRPTRRTLIWQSSNFMNILGMIRILFLGDIVGELGRKTVINELPTIRENRGVDFVIVNGENAANGRGITPKIAIDLLRSGVAVITTGDHIWDQKEIITYLPTEPRLLRPINYPPQTPGQGSVVLSIAKAQVAVINVQARTFTMPNLENPFLILDRELQRLSSLSDPPRVIFVDVHGETTSEKIALGRFLDGRVSVVVGTHTHVQTADERIFPGGTAFLCDAGMCGPDESILGREIPCVLHRFITSMPSQLHIAKGPVRLCGLTVDVDEKTGRAIAIERLSILCEQSSPPTSPLQETLSNAQRCVES